MGKKKYKIPCWKHDLRNDTKSIPKFASLYHDMLVNEKFINLSNHTKVIYLYMSDWSNGSQEFEFPYSVYKKITTRKTFYKALKELCENGFIEIIGSGKNTRTPNKYKFSSGWYMKH